MEFQSLLQRLDAEAAIDRVRQTPSYGRNWVMAM